MVGLHLQYVFMCGIQKCEKHKIAFSNKMPVKRFDAHIKEFSFSQTIIPIFPPDLIKQNET